MPVLVFLVIWLFFGTGLVMVGTGAYAAYSRFRYSKHQYWSKTQGSITRAWIAKALPVGGLGYAAGYNVNVTYTYSVDGKEHLSTHHYRQPELVLAERIAQGYTEDRPVTVYYDPRNPHRSTLQPEEARVSYVSPATLIGAGLLLSVGAVYLLSQLPPDALLCHAIVQLGSANCT